MGENLKARADTLSVANKHSKQSSIATDPLLMTPNTDTLGSPANWASDLLSMSLSAAWLNTPEWLG